MSYPRQVLPWLSFIIVDAMSQTGLTLTHNKPMHVPDMSYTSSHNVDDACPRHVLH
ncbi:hypothetical protein F383_14279 [Gossypium arboreum]|uniref:Uncharacterized protein n=1 Tax=Gossypium arboreum TaxID=29729 RepID=A0A0B0M7E0_GOSAR|nr:hypothetical protein F383_37299 [Gossypium arboreum]KHG28900.1 hypothetical protein F383_14279 [Gossypium arboreum]